MRVFFTIWAGQLVSIIGSGLTSFALGVWVYQQTGSVTQLSLILLFRILPNLALSPLAGALVDRWDKRLTMIVADTGASLSSLGIALLFFTGTLQVWHIYVGVAIAALFEAFQLPAYLTTVTLLVPEEHYGRSSGLIQLAQASADIVSPMLAGLLMVTVQMQGILFIDFLTYVAAVATLLLVRLPVVNHIEAGPEKPLLHREIREGFRYIVERPALVVLTLYFALVYFLGGIITAVIEPMVLAFATPDVLGIVLSVAGSGLFVGSLLLSLWGGPARKIDGVLGFCFLFGLFLVVMGLKPIAWLIAASAFGAHFTIPFINGSNQAIWQSRVALPLQGRVFAIRQMVTRAAQPVAFIAAGPLADGVFGPLLMPGGGLAGSLGQVMGVGVGRGLGLMFVTAGVLTMLLAISGCLSPVLRQVDN
jgi:DHA3 family macrolide efflux protein-like MFS transporter